MKLCNTCHAHTDSYEKLLTVLGLKFQGYFHAKLSVWFPYFVGILEVFFVLCKLRFSLFLSLEIFENELPGPPKNINVMNAREPLNLH